MPPKKVPQASTEKLDLVPLVGKAMSNPEGEARHKLDSEIGVNRQEWACDPDFSYKNDVYNGKYMTNVGFIVANCQDHELAWLLRTYSTALNYHTVAYAVSFKKHHQLADELFKEKDADAYFIARGAMDAFKQTNDPAQCAYLPHFYEASKYDKKVPCAILSSGIETALQLRTLLIKFNHEKLNRALVGLLVEDLEHYRKNVTESRTLKGRLAYLEKWILGMHAEGSRPELRLEFGTPALEAHQEAERIELIKKTSKVSCCHAVIWQEHHELITTFMRGKLNILKPCEVNLLPVSYITGLTVKELIDLYTKVTGEKPYNSEVPTATAVVPQKAVGRSFTR